MANLDEKKLSIFSNFLYFLVGHPIPFHVQFLVFVDNGVIGVNKVSGRGQTEKKPRKNSNFLAKGCPMNFIFWGCIGGHSPIIFYPGLS